MLRFLINLLFKLILSYLRIFLSCALEIFELFYGFVYFLKILHPKIIKGFWKWYDIRQICSWCLYIGRFSATLLIKLFLLCFGIFLRLYSVLMVFSPKKHSKIVTDALMWHLPNLLGSFRVYFKFSYKMISLRCALEIFDYF